MTVVVGAQGPVDNMLVNEICLRVGARFSFVWSCARGTLFTRFSFMIACSSCRVTVENKAPLACCISVALFSSPHPLIHWPLPCAFGLLVVMTFREAGVCLCRGSRMAPQRCRWEDCVRLQLEVKF